MALQLSGKRRRFALGARRDPWSTATPPALASKPGANSASRCALGGDNAISHCSHPCERNYPALK